MHATQQLIMPWAQSSELYSAPGRLVMKLALGEAPEAIPTALDVRRGAARPVERVDGGPVDRILRKLGGAARVARVHTAANSLGKTGAHHQGFDDLEHATGLARTFRVETADDCSIADLVDALRQLDCVEEASPLYLCATPFSSANADTASFEAAWQSREMIGAPEAMAYEPGDPAVITAIVDTGVAAEHPDLRQRLRPGLDAVQLGHRDLANGVQLLGDLSGIDADPEDEVGHGTACAAIVGALGSGLPPGLAGECGLLPIRVLGAARVSGKAEPVGVGRISDIDFGVKTAIDLGATVINMSFGTPERALDSDDPRPHADVVRYGLARGCVMVAASGNSGKEERFLPAALDGVIAVGSVNADGKLSGFSTRGGHVKLSAPGEKVVSANLKGYQLATGTSFAAPFVAAAAALLVSRSRKRSHPTSAEKIGEILQKTARPWRPGEGAGGGSGVLNVHAALQQLDREVDQNAGFAF